MSEDARDDRPPRAARSLKAPMPVGEVVARLKLDRMPAKTPAPARGRPGRIITGRFEAHGPANYQFRPDGSLSYYVKILSSRGTETLWGVDLERAIKRSKTQPQIGSVIGAQRVGSEPVALPARGADHATDRQRTFRRSQWKVESITFFADSLQRARRDREAQLADQKALHERPELRSAFVSLHAAQKFAERNIRDPRDRELFVERVKAVMALSVRNGVPMPEPRRHAPAAAPTPRRDDPTR